MRKVPSMSVLRHTCLRPVTAGALLLCSLSLAHAYTSAVIHLLAERAPGLLKTLREHEPDFVLFDGTLAECDRVGDGQDFRRRTLERPFVREGPTNRLGADRRGDGRPVWWRCGS